MKIKEIIVVEGRDDARAVKSAVSAEIIITHGFGMTGETLRRIAFARNQRGVIVFTDPDHAGERIRKRINDRIPGCKNAYLTRQDAVKGDDIGIENAGAESIVGALTRACGVTDTATPCFTRLHLVKHRLSGVADAAARREALGRILGIGYANAKQLVNRLNGFGISLEQFHAALDAIDFP